MVRAKVTCKLLFSPLEWLGPVVIDSGKQDKWRIFPPFFVWKHSCLAFSNGRLWNHSLQSFPSYLQTWRQPDPLSPCNFRTHFILLCQQVLLIPRNGVRGGFWCLFGGSWPLVHCGNWMVDSGWWLCFSWGYLVSWLNIFEWPLECSAEAGGLTKDSFASHSCSCLCKVCFEPRWQEEELTADQFETMETWGRIWEMLFKISALSSITLLLLLITYINGGMACQDSQEKVIG